MTPLRILLVLTRDPRGRSSGRKLVQRTIIRSLVALGHSVTAAYFGPTEDDPGQDVDTGPRLTFLALTGAGRIERALALAGAAVFARSAINEALYHSRRADRELAALMSAQGADLVVTDMIRTARHGAASGLPWIADLDDLLSARYAQMAADRAAPFNLMGYLRAPALRAFLPLLGLALPALLRREAGILRRREAQVVRQASLTTLVSATEAAALSAAAGRRVVATPMAVAGPRHYADPATRPGEMAFLGGMDYGPNLTSLRGFDRIVRPGLMQAGVGPFRLDVIGVADAAQRRGFSPAIRFCGYADDLDAAVQRYRVLLVPQLPPGGIKTKIVVAARNGTLVLAHRSALGGMGMTEGQDVLAWTSAPELAARIEDIRAGRLDCTRMAERAQLWAIAGFGDARLCELWQRNLEMAMAHRQGAPL